MAAHLLIDGYNVMKGSSLAGLTGSSDLEGARRHLLDELFRYKRGKGIRITVVFDGGRGPSQARQQEAQRGVEVIFSRKGETADDVIVEYIRARRPGLVVVTSDRAIIDEAKRCKVPFITTPRLEAALLGSGLDDEDEDRTEKKGNPRKAPKGIRRARKAIKKL
ncbi:MAG: NYN domain-containing protein [Syntrophorhabdales bacterium]